MSLPLFSGKATAGSRYRILYAFLIFFIGCSFLVRLALFVLSFRYSAPGLLSSLRIFGTGLFFDIGVAAFFGLAYSLYLLLLPRRLNNTLFNKIVTYAGFFLATLIAMFSFFAEFAFWDEFQSRFNFIAVDYLIYTYEVVKNINESYPLPYLIGGMVLASGVILYLVIRSGSFSVSFHSPNRFRQRLPHALAWLILSVFYISFITNQDAEWSENRYRNELSKAGIYSFFAAFRTNELEYESFYRMQDVDSSLAEIKYYLTDSSASWDNSSRGLRRTIRSGRKPVYPNVFMVTIESLSADFLQRYGSIRNLTPTLDSLCQHSLVFDRMFATGTRTVRGMEALSLAIPPTPGNSIVRRPDNGNLYGIGEIFRQKGYDRSFIYGGDGYFDNMNQYFGSNGFDIIDRSRGFSLGDNFHAKRTVIRDSQVHFENAWGISDEDIYNVALGYADEEYKAGKPFYSFIMTTSNHKPYTYPSGLIDIPSGSGRDGAVKYTDYAIRQLLEKARSRPWFSNTVFIFVADHCASSAGVNEIDVAKYHIPCIVFNLPGTVPDSLEQLCSQIDLYPTLLYLLGWDYESNLFGKNVYTMKPADQRTFVATYQKLGYLEGDRLLILSPGRKADLFRWDAATDTQAQLPMDSILCNKATAWYETANYLYKNGGLKKPIHSTESLND